MAELYTLRKPLADAVAWLTLEIIGNEVQTPLPASLRPYIAKRMVEDERMGWPDLDSAEGTLDDWEWTP